MNNKLIINDLINIMHQNLVPEKRNLVGSNDKQTEDGIILSPGIRDATFYEFLRNMIMKAGKIQQEYLDKYFLPQNKILFEAAFTSQAFDPINNYEIYEQIGDAALGNFLILYFIKRFPNLMNSGGVAIIARLKINYGSKDKLSEIAESLNFWPYISCTEEERNKKKRHILEDVFEAFIGVMVIITTKIIGQWQGNKVISLILEKIFNEIPISLNHEDLYDSKTILKEIFDSNKSLGELLYVSYPKDEYGNILTEVFQINNGKKTLLGSGKSTNKKDSEKRAAKSALELLKKKKIYINNNL